MRMFLTAEPALSDEGTRKLAQIVADGYHEPSAASVAWAERLLPPLDKTSLQEMRRRVAYALDEARGKQ